MPYFGLWPLYIFPGIAGNPDFTKFFWLPESLNWVNTCQNRLISGSGQATSACHISRHTCHAFFLECQETPNTVGRADERTDGCWPTLCPLRLRRRGQEWWMKGTKEIGLVTPNNSPHAGRSAISSDASAQSSIWLHTRTSLTVVPSLQRNSPARNYITSITLCSRSCCALF